MLAVKEGNVRIEENKEKGGIFPSVFVYLNSEHILWIVLADV